MAAARNVPSVLLGKIETHAAFSELLILIGCFTAGLMLLRALDAYIDLNTLPGRIEVRIGILTKIVKKNAVCSYPLIEDLECQNWLAKAREVVQSSNAAEEAIWKTFYEI